MHAASPAYPLEQRPPAPPVPQALMDTTKPHSASRVNEAVKSSTPAHAPRSVHVSACAPKYPPQSNLQRPPPRATL